MKLKPLGICSALALTLAVAACEKSSPATPSDLNTSAQPARVTDAVTGISITAPVPVTPANNQQFRNAEQPVTLVVRNGVSTGTSALTYTFEVASDAAFASRAYTRENVAEGGGGQTSLRIDRIGADKTYFWRVRANSGTQAGPYSTTRSFSIGPEVILQTPALISPENNGQASGNPTFTVANVARTGPAGQVFYRFEVSTSSTFEPLALAQTVAEQGGGRTSFTYQVPANTPAGTYFWRVQASDPSNGVTSPFSATFQFRYQPFDMRNAIILNSPAEMGYWPETGRITSVNFTVEAFEVDFTKRDGPDRWPDFTPPGWSGSLQYTLGMCVNPSGNQWYCSAVVQFWHGRALSDSTPPSYVGRNWFYDGRWNPIVGYNPSNGEIVGLFAAAGNQRDQTFGFGLCPARCERTNVVLVPWHNDDAALYTFGANATANAVTNSPLSVLLKR
jgi:hypothetical protein